MADVQQRQRLFVWCELRLGLGELRPSGSARERVGSATLSATRHTRAEEERGRRQLAGTCSHACSACLGGVSSIMSEKLKGEAADAHTSQENSRESLVSVWWLWRPSLSTQPNIPQYHNRGVWGAEHVSAEKWR